MDRQPSSTLTDEQLAEIRVEIEREIARLDRTMQSSAEAARPVQLDQSAMGRLSRIDALQNQQLSIELHSREVARHALLLEALERIETGIYGCCTACRRPMPFGRLLVFPEARTCATCAA